MSYRTTNRTKSIREGNLRKKKATTVRSSKIYPVGTIVEHDEEEMYVSCVRMTDKGIVYELVGDGVAEFNIKAADISLIEKASPESLRELKALMKEKY